MLQWHLQTLQTKGKAVMHAGQSFFWQGWLRTYRFEERLKEYSSLWCCVNAHPRACVVRPHVGCSAPH